MQCISSSRGQVTLLSYASRGSSPGLPTLTTALWRFVRAIAMLNEACVIESHIHSVARLYTPVG